MMKKARIRVSQPKWLKGKWWVECSDEYSLVHIFGFPYAEAKAPVEPRHVGAMPGVWEFWAQEKLKERQK